MPESYGAVFSERDLAEHARRQLQERARLHLNEVTDAMMRSDDPGSLHHLIVAATSEWRGHNLIWGDHDDTAPPTTQEQRR